MTFKNISYNGNTDNGSVFSGFDSTRLVTDVTFENLQINGIRILDANSANFQIGKSVEDYIQIDRFGIHFHYRAWDSGMIIQ